MWFQPLIYFTALLWAVFFVLFGLYAAFRRGRIPLLDRVAGLISALLVGGIGAGAMIGAFYLIQELI